MSNELISFEKNETIEKRLKYELIGVNQELGLAYRGNGKNYIVDDVFFDEYKLKVPAANVENFMEKHNIELEETLNLLYAVHAHFNAFNNMVPRSQYFSDQITNIAIKDEEKIEEGLSILIEKYGYGPVFSYFNDAKDSEIIGTFRKDKYTKTLDGVQLNCFNELDKIMEELSIADENGSIAKYNEEYEEYGVPTVARYANGDSYVDVIEDEDGILTTVRTGK